MFIELTSHKQITLVNMSKIIFIQSVSNHEWAKACLWWGSWEDGEYMYVEEDCEEIIGKTKRT